MDVVDQLIAGTITVREALAEGGRSGKPKPGGLVFDDSLLKKFAKQHRGAVRPRLTGAAAREHERWIAGLKRPKKRSR